MTRFNWARRRDNSRAGFTLVEALIALAITGAILVIIAEFSGQALRNWRRGTETIAFMEMATTAFRRIAKDVAAAVAYQRLQSPKPTTGFQGGADGLVFVTDNGATLEFVSIRTVKFEDGYALIREQGPAVSEGAQLGDPVVLLRGAFEARFTYHDGAGQRMKEWQQQNRMPTAVEIELVTSQGDSVFPVRAVLPLAANVTPDCVIRATRQENKERCAEVLRQQTANAPPGSQDQKKNE